METAKAINLYEAYMRYGQAGDYRSAFACLEKGFRGAKKQLALLNGFRKVCKKHIKDGDRIEMFYELLHKSYVLSAPYRFDDFMIALEWYRPPEKKFWLPRREKLLAVCEAMQDLADDKLDELFLSQPPRTGKLLSDDTPVLTTKGWKKHGDLRVGDYVFSDMGEAVMVTHVFPKGVANRLITFTDGTKIKCHANHEWPVYDRKRQTFATYETDYFMSHALDNSNSAEKGKRGYRHHYQSIARVPIKGSASDLAVKPYTLGAWLGDGRNNNPDICGTKEDYAIVEGVIADGYEVSWHTTHKTTGVEYYGFKGLRKALQTYGMCHSRKRTEKHIPQEYLVAGIEDRLQLLAGLLDTDGTYIPNEHRYHFCTADPELKETFIDLIRTFGWRVCVMETEPSVSSSGVCGRKKYWSIGFNPTMYIPCRLERKQAKAFSKQRRIAIESVEEIEPVPGNCISVQGGIYLAGREMIPTHNSTLVQFWLIWQMCKDPEATNLYSSYTKDVVDIFFNGILEIFNDSDTYDLQTIFPKAVVANTNAAIGFMNVGRKKKYPSFMCRAINAALNGLADASGAIVIDDIHSGIDEARNPDLLAKTWSTVSNNLLSRRKGGTKHLWIGTRWSIYDCISRRIDLIQTNPNFKNWRYKIVNVPALNDKDESNFDYPYGLGFSTDAFKKVRASFAESDDMASWLAQFMGTPIERDGAVFEPSAMRYYNGELPKEEPDRVFMAVDPSWGGGDYVAACVVVQYGNELYIPDVVYSNTDKYGSEPLVVECAIRNNVAAMYVEGTRVTGTYADELSARFKERGYYINLQRTTKHWASQSGKTQRIFDRAPDIKSKMVFLDEQNRTKEYQQFMQSVFSFTYEGKNKHDDAPDCLAMAIVHLMQRAQKVRSISWSVLDGISA